jgi:hypothetical protein
MLVAWAFAPLAWLFQDASRLLLQWNLAGSVIGALFVEFLLSHIARPAVRVTFATAIFLIAALVPLSLPGWLPEVLWVAGVRYPRMLEWEEARGLAEILHRDQLDRRLVYVYNHSFSPALAAYHPMSFERGHWVEVQPRPNPANQLSAGIKAYVMPVPPDDVTLRTFERESLLVIHGGTTKSSVVTLPRPGDLARVAMLISRTVPDDARWLSEHAMNNTLGDVKDLFSKGAIEARRIRLREQRIHAGRIAVAALVYAYALEPKYPRLAEGSRGSVRGFSSIAAFLSDEWSIGFIGDARHQRLRENFRRFAEEASKLGDRVTPFEELDRATDRLFDEYFWAA